MHLYEHQIATNASQQMTKVTGMVREDIEKSGVKEGIAVIFSPHTTAGFTINENADPDVKTDMIRRFEEVYPWEHKLDLHMEGNTAAHLKASTVGSSQHIIIHDGQLLLGTWQGIYFCEFDGPRHRSYTIKLITG